MEKKELKKFEKSSLAWADIIAKQAISGEYTKEGVKDMIMSFAKDYRLPVIDDNRELTRQLFELTAEINMHIPTHDEAKKLVDDFIDEWSKNNPTLDKDFYWSGVNDGVYLLIKHLTRA
jgi:DNA-nicking Smr family endonuclease